MDRKIICLTVLVISITLLAGCNELGGGKEVTPEQALNKAPQAMEEIDTYSAEADLLMTVSGNATQSMSNSEEMSMGMNITTDVDLVNKKMRTEGKINFRGMEMPTEVYVIGKTKYQKEPQRGLWIKRELEEDPFTNPAKALVENLGQDFESKGTQTVQGQECFVIEGTPDKNNAGDFLSPGLGAAENPGQEFIDAIESLTATVWISKNDYTVKKTKIGLTMQQQGTKFKMEMENQYKNFGQQMDISLPEEAKNATEASNLPSGGIQPTPE